MKTLEELIKELPPELQQEVYGFTLSLIKTKALDEKIKTTIRQKKLRMSWAGGLREFREQFTSMELQKKALEWWGD